MGCAVGAGVGWGGWGTRCRGDASGVRSFATANDRTLPRKVRASRMGHPGCPREQATGLSTKPKDEAVWLRSR